MNSLTVTAAVVKGGGRASMLRVKSSEPVVLLWDDYQGDKPDALRAFLELQAPPANPRGTVVKRVITSWPTLNVLGEKARDPLYAERELRAIVPPEELVAYARRLLPKLEPAGAARIVRTAEARPEAVLRALALILQGVSVDRLPPNPLEAAYDDLIKRLMKARDLSERSAVKNALLALALAGSVDLGNRDHRNAFDEAGITDEALGALVDLRTAARYGEVYSLNLDSFRGHIVRRCLDHERIDVLSGGSHHVAKLARPFLIEWFHAIWGICVLATEGTRHRNSIQTELLAAFDEASREWSADRAAQIAPRIVNATVGEPDPRQRVALADRIGELLARHDTADIALPQTMALHNERDRRRVRPAAARGAGRPNRGTGSRIRLPRALNGKALSPAPAPGVRTLLTITNSVG